MPVSLHRLAPALNRFHRDHRGVAALEFAFIAPVMILLYFGLAQLGLGLMAQRRVNHAASAIGDLTAQSTKGVTDSDVTNIMAAGNTLLQPFDGSPLQLRVSSLTVQANKTGKVEWSEVKSGGQADLPSLACKSTVSTIPANLPVNAGDSLVMAEAVYRYNSPISYLVAGTYKFAPRVFLPPRGAGAVSRYKGGSTTAFVCP